jgi:hypothetical protein
VKRTLLLFVSIAALWSCADQQSGSPDNGATGERARCEAERDRILDERVADVQFDREQHRAALLDGIGEQLVQSCLTGGEH